MLVNVTEVHGQQRSMGQKDGCQLLPIDETYRVYHRVTNGHRRVMQSHNQREIPAQQRFGKALLLPVQL